MPQTLPLHAAVANALRDHGVETLFGVMGDANLFIVDHYVRRCAGRYVPAVHEAGAVLMAMGHAAVTGGVGVATITQGPALSNAATALCEGVKGHLPIVLLCGDTPAADPDHLQAISQRAMVDATGAGLVRIVSPASAVQDIAEAFRRAQIERRPIVVNMPVDLMWDDVPYDRTVLDVPDLPVAPGEGAALDDAIGIIAAARRPLILAGRGAIGARAALLRLADRIGAPVATTLEAKGLFHGAPYDLGVCGTVSTPAASDIIGGSDCVISFGAGLNRFTTVYGSVLEGKRVVQVDADMRQLGRFHPADAMLTGDPALVAETFLHWLDEAEIPSSQATDDIDPAALRAPPPAPAATQDPATLNYYDALDRIDRTVPADRIFVSDGGRFMTEAWCRITVTEPRHFVQSVHVGAIGLGMGYAIGAAVARPDQMTLFLCGDGGFMMGGLAEFSTAVREGLNLVAVICNDSAYGAEYVQFEDRDMDPGLSLLSWPSFAAMAQAMGATGVTVRTLDDLDTALDGVTGPALIELVLDPAAMPRMHK